MKHLELLDRLCAAGALADIDRAFAGLIAELAGDAALAPVAALASAAHRAGHVCLTLSDCAGQRIVDAASALPRGDVDPAELPLEVAQARLPTLAALRSVLQSSDAVAEVGSETIRPLVLDGDRLYLQRMFDAERSLASAVHERAGRFVNDSEGDDALVRRLFPEGDDETANAARIALRCRLCIVTGGPGTGKTTLAARIVALLVGSQLAKPRRIALAAPTGKAAARLEESVAAQIAELAAFVPALQGQALRATTLHRLLQGEPLRIDALIVDECSMVDLVQATRLLKALPEHCRLVLLGDASQLASVQPGSVFSDLCAAGAAPESPLAHCAARLSTSRRFDASGGIGRLAAAVLAGDMDGADAALADKGDEQTALRPLASGEAFDRLARDYASAHCAPVVRALRDSDEPTAARPFPNLRVLCAHRRGPFGANRFNRLVERRLKRQLGIDQGEAFYAGRPVIVTRNDPQTGLANGDTGVVIDTAEGKAVWFPDLRQPNGDATLISPARLPAHETFFALTVHRAQGSEYDEIAFVPGPPESPVNTRELFYTAITRARRKVTVHASRQDVRVCVSRATTRGTGLLARLSDVTAPTAAD